MGFGHAGRIVRPGLVERPVDEGVALPRHTGRKDPDLAIGDLAGRPRILTATPTRRLALLEEASLIRNKNRIRVGQRLERRHPSGRDPE